VAITIDWPNKIINVPRADMALNQLNPTEIRELPLNWFRMQLKDLEDDPIGMNYPDTHRHNTEVALGGLTYARVIEIINDYTITFEDGQYAVNLTGANSNVGDRVNVNQVSVRSANSAGMTSSPDIEYSSFNGMVYVDFTSPYAGTLFPIGTPRQPVNNTADAEAIAVYRGFTTLHMTGNITLGAGVNISNYKIVGSNAMRCFITIEPEAAVNNCEITEATVTGTLDGGTLFRSCVIDGINYVNGIIHQCALTDKPIVLGGNMPCVVLGSYAMVYGGSSTINIDFNNSCVALMIRDCSGTFRLHNLTTPCYAGIGLASGGVIIDASCTDGTVNIGGVINKFIDYSSGAVDVIMNAIVNVPQPVDNAVAVWEYERA